MAIPFPQISTLNDVRRWCEGLYRELSFPFVQYTGNSSVWENVNCPLYAGKLDGANDPAWTKLRDDGVSSNGLYAYSFANGENIYLSAHIPHSYREGTSIYPHVHFYPNGNESGKVVNIGIEYTWTSIGEIISAYSSSLEAEISVENNSQWEHHMGELGELTGATETVASSLLIRLYRLAPTVGTDFSGEIIITDLDFHIESDTHGSRGKYTK